MGGPETIARAMAGRLIQGRAFKNRASAVFTAVGLKNKHQAHIFKF